MPRTDHRLSLLLALADDELILGHRLAEWTGWVPYVEEDLALSSIAQDEIAHARALFEIASVVDGRTVDELALGRQQHEYRNAWICEHPNRDFAYTIARQWLYDTADDVRLRTMERSSFKELREVATVMLLEERYHLDHANAWFTRLANGPVEARHRLGDALHGLLGEAGALFETLPDEGELVADATLPRPMTDLRDEWFERIAESLRTVGLDHILDGSPASPPGEMIPTSAGEIEPAGGDGEPAGTPSRAGAGGRSGRHSEDFEPLWQEMTAMYRAHPGATW